MFCDPHSPWQRGLIENTNGIFRRGMPRKTEISQYSLRDIDEIAWPFNSTPRKCLGYKKPAKPVPNNTVALRICSTFVTV